MAFFAGDASSRLAGSESLRTGRDAREWPMALLRPEVKGLHIPTVSSGRPEASIFVLRFFDSLTFEMAPIPLDFPSSVFSTISSFCRK